jgi:hypothetical protein
MKKDRLEFPDDFFFAISPDLFKALQKGHHST